MKNEIYSKLTNSQIFNCINDVFIQDETTITLYV